jgi:Kef-type K+ transport system membrane component KefB
MRQPVPLVATLVAIMSLAAAPACAATADSGVHIQQVLLGLVLIIAGAKLGGSLFARFGQSPVLGELLAGVLIGNLGLLGFHGLDALEHLSELELLAEIGVLFLLFEVGLHSNLGQMLAVGASSLIVAVLGVVAPMILGYFCTSWFFPGHNPLTYWFVGATLCATSVGITARVLQDLQRTASVEGRIILGAAVIDDVLGLIVLAVVSGIIQAADAGRAFDPMSGLFILLKAVVFLAVAVWAGRWLSRHAFRIATRMRAEGMLLSTALGLCFGFAFLAGAVGLAPIVGAFAAGLVLDEVHYQDLKERDQKQRGIPELLEPLATFLVPVFFVLMGMRVDLSVFGNAGVLGFAAVLTLAAVVGKQVCGLGVLERGADRLAVGLGMIPRGEVGLIFASIGAALTIAGERVVDDAVFSAVVAMVALTTLMTPPLLVWRMKQIVRKGMLTAR